VDLSRGLLNGIGTASVPAHAGGVDLSKMGDKKDPAFRVPAHAGGVDLSMTKRMNLPDQAKSPPMRAGWI